MVEYTYDSWGKIVSSTSSLDGDLRYNQPFRYRGYVYDKETGWYYLQSRYYDPTTCRFISADVLLSTGQGVIGHNAFAYCGNNPISRKDDSGDLWQLIGALVGAAIGVVGQYVSDVVENVMEGKTGSDIFKPTSSIVDYAAAAASGALAGSGIGLLGSVLMNTAISTTAYVVNCDLGYKEYNSTDLLLSIGSGAVSGLIGGEGANLKYCEGVYNTSKQILKTAVSPKKIALYTAKITTIKAGLIKASIRTFLAPTGSRLFNKGLHALI